MMEKKTSGRKKQIKIGGKKPKLKKIEEIMKKKEKKKDLKKKVIFQIAVTCRISGYELIRAFSFYLL